MEFTLPTMDLGSVTVTALLMIVVMLFARGQIISRKVADQEQASLIAGHAAKDEAHAEMLALKDEIILDLHADRVELRGIISQREHQLTLMLEEIAPSLQMWADATRSVIDEDGGRDESA